MIVFGRKSKHERLKKNLFYGRMGMFVYLFEKIHLIYSEIKDRKQRKKQRKKGQADKEKEKGIRFLSMKGGRY